MRDSFIIEPKDVGEWTFRRHGQRWDLPLGAVAQPGDVGKLIKRRNYDSFIMSRIETDDEARDRLGLPDDATDFRPNMEGAA